MLSLVCKINDAFGIYRVNGELVIFPLRTPYCPMIYGDEPCYGELLLHDFRCYRHYVPGEKPHIHCDVHMKCGRCGNLYTFGLSIPPFYLSELQKSRYHGRTLRDQLVELYKQIKNRELDEKVLERLKSHGYW